MTTSFILVNEEILLPFARFAKCECGSLQVLARRARLQQIRRGLVDLMNRGDAGRWLCRRPAASGPDVRGVCDTPGVRQQLDFVFVK